MTAYLIPILNGTSPGKTAASERTRNSKSTRQRETPAMDIAAYLRIGKKQEQISRGREMEMKIERRSQRRRMQKKQKKKKKQIYWRESK